MGDAAREGKVAVIGTGLIGGSIGLALLKSSPQLEVHGFDDDRRCARAAMEAGAVTTMATSLSEAVEEAATVVLAVPTDAVAAVASEVAAAPGAAVVTDVGSAKHLIVEAATAALGSRFVGGHPMAGSERRGIEAATPDLFQGASWILTPSDVTSQDAYRTVRALVTRVGARPVAMAARDHDALIARLSHVPQLVASALVTLAASDAADTALLGLAAGGFRDVTRIAASDPGLWTSIVRTNKASVLAALDGFSGHLRELRELVEEGSWDGLQSFLAAARGARLDLFQKPSYEGEPHNLALLIPDRPGVLAEVTTAAGQIGANIEDIKIFHSPEGGTGRLELTVSGESASSDLAQRLTALGYRVQQDPIGI